MTDMRLKARFDPFYMFCSNGIVIIVTDPSGRGGVTLSPWPSVLASRCRSMPL